MPDYLQNQKGIEKKRSLKSKACLKIEEIDLKLNEKTKF